MKKTKVTISEAAFVQKAIFENIRVDGRKPHEFRKIKINYGSSWGNVHVSLGETRALAHITCEVVEPKTARPNEGLIFFNLEIGPMAAPHLEPFRPTENVVVLNRLLEKIFQESNCVDLESLCIVSEEKVWKLRVDIKILNDEGNIMDCASIAALAALLHYRRPDITMSGQEVIVNTLSEKDPLPIVLHHFPVCVSHAVFNNGKIAIADPTALEERISEAKIIFGLNSYNELCAINVSGKALINPDLLVRTGKIAATEAKNLVQFVKNCAVKDAEIREAGETISFMECVRTNKISSNIQENPKIKLKKFNATVPQNEDEISVDFKMETSDNEESESCSKVVMLGSKSAVLFSNEDPTASEISSNWIPEQNSSSNEDDEEEDDDDDDSDEEMNEESVKEVKSKAKIRPKKNKRMKMSKKKTIDEDDSEEEEKSTFLLSEK